MQPRASVCTRGWSFTINGTFTRLNISPLLAISADREARRERWLSGHSEQGLEKIFRGSVSTKPPGKKWGEENAVNHKLRLSFTRPQSTDKWYAKRQQ